MNNWEPQWSIFSPDLLLLICFSILWIGLILFINRRRLFLLLASTYLTAGIIYLIPWLKQFFLNNSIFFLWQWLILVLILVVVIWINRSFWESSSKKYFQQLWQVVLISFLTVALIYSLFFSVLSLTQSKIFFNLTLFIFQSPLMLVIWTIFPLFIIFLINQKE